MGIYPVNEIQVLETWEAIRKRPTMYLGPLDNPLIPNTLLEEALCMARAANLKGEGLTKVRIETFGGGTAILTDDGPGWDVTVGPRGQRLAEVLLRHLFGCQEAKDPEHKGLCNVGVVTLVALSSEFRFTTRREGRLWTQRYEAGRPVTPFEDQGPSTERGTRLAFTLDNTVLPNVEFDQPRLRVFAEILRSDGLIVELIS